MRLSRAGRGIAALTVVLFLFALFFDIDIAAIAAAGLIFFLTTRAFIFLSALSSISRSLIIQRSLSTLFARQGFPISVETDVQIKVPFGFSLKISDILPEGANLSSGNITASLEKSQSCRLNYAFILESVGAHTFAGVRLCFSDYFFSSEIVNRIVKFTLPSFIILPSSEYLFSNESSYVERKSSIVPPLIGHEVQSFIEASPGDDFRKIDWKISAKYNTIFVREYTGRVEVDSLLIIDLPDSQQKFHPEVFLRLKELAISVVAKQLQFQNRLSILLISGPNLLSFIQLEQDTKRFVDMITKLTPTRRYNFMYRYNSNSALKYRFSALTGSVDTFSKNLTRISDAFLTNRPPNAFESKLNWIFNSISAKNVHIFTLNIQDNSHIRIIARLAAIRSMYVYFHIPREESCTASRACFIANLSGFEV